MLQAGTPQMAAAGPGKELRVIPVTGGSFEGPSLRGEVVPGTTAPIGTYWRPREYVTWVSHRMRYGGAATNELDAADASERAA